MRKNHYIRSRKYVRLQSRFQRRTKWPFRSTAVEVLVAWVTFSGHFRLKQPTKVTYIPIKDPIIDIIFRFRVWFHWKFDFSVFTASGPSLWSHVKMTILTMYYLGSECCCKTYPSESVSFKRIFNWSADKLNSKSSYSWSKSSSSYQFPFWCIHPWEKIQFRRIGCSWIGIASWSRQIATKCNH